MRDNGRCAVRGAQCAVRYGRSTKWVIASLVIAFSAASVGAAPLSATDSRDAGVASAERNEAEYLLGPEDALAIAVVKHPEFSGSAAVRPDGRISAPGLGEFQAAGKSAAALEASLREALARWIRQPLVTVTVTQFRSLGMVFVLGQVAKPGAYPYRPGLTAAEALALAGGPLLDADMRRAAVIRADQARVEADQARVEVDLSPLARKGEAAQHVLLNTGDMLVLPQARRPHVQVLGEVSKPGDFEITEETTLLEVIHRAEGPRVGANLKGATLTRAGVASPLDLDALLRRGDTKVNVRLQDGDSILVPENRMKVYVIGEVAKPDTFLLPEQATVLDALTAAGWHTPQADLKNVRLGHRDGNGTIDVQTFDLSRLVDRRKPLPPPPVRDGDVLLVPSKTKKKSVQDYIPFIYPIEVLTRLLGG
jgi:polysaccharide export outer membrane protein